MLGSHRVPRPHAVTMGDEAKQSYPCEVCGDPGYRHCASCRQVSFCRCVRLDPPPVARCSGVRVHRRGLGLCSRACAGALLWPCYSPDHEHRYWLSDHQFRCSLAMTELGACCAVPSVSCPGYHTQPSRRTSAPQQDRTPSPLALTLPSSCASCVRALATGCAHLLGPRSQRAACALLSHARPRHVLC